MARLEAQNLLLEKAAPLEQIPPTPPDGSILDAGSGTGFWSLRLAGRVPLGRITCLDRSRELLDLARQRLTPMRSIRAEYLHQDLRQLDLPAQAFDLIFTSVTLAHVQELESTLSKLTAALKPGGWIACFEPMQTSGRYCEVHPPCPSASFLMDHVFQTARDRGSDLVVALKIAHDLDRLGMERVTMKDYGKGLHGEEAVFCISKVFMPLAKAYLSQSLSPEVLEQHLDTVARELSLPSLWLDLRRTVVLAQRPRQT